MSDELRRRWTEVRKLALKGAETGEPPYLYDSTAIGEILGMDIAIEDQEARHGEAKE